MQSREKKIIKKCFVTKVAEISNSYDINLPDEDIEKSSEYDYKSYIIKKLRQTSIKECITKLRCIAKVKHIKYDNIDESQQYLCSFIFFITNRAVYPYI